jgi:hypothetical protein
MPRPNPPSPLLIPTVLPFSLDDHQQRDLAKVLRLKSISPLVSGAIAEAIGYQAGLSLAAAMTFSYLAVRHMLG